MVERALRLNDVAERYGVSAYTVRVWARAGKIPHLRLPGGEYRFRHADLEAFDNQCLVQETPDPATASTIANDPADKEPGTSIIPIRPRGRRDPWVLGSRIQQPRKKPKSSETNS